VRIFRVCSRVSRRWAGGALAGAVLFFGAAVPAPAQDKTVELLQELSNVPGPSGLEEPVRKIMVERMTPLADQLSYDGLGSVIASQGKSGPRIMIDAHMDEVGAMVRRITPDGFLSMQLLGGWVDEALPGQRWIILGSKGVVHATSTVRDDHLVSNDEATKLYDNHDNVFLDVGAKNAEEVAKMGIRPGDSITPDSSFLILNGTQNYLGKAWDDRAGCALLIEAMQRLQRGSHANQLFYSATVQEETGLTGGHTAAAQIKPDVAIVLEGGVTNDVPGERPDLAQEVLGGGPGLFLFNTSELPNRKYLELARQTAKEKGIPLQDELVVNYGDNAAEIQKSTNGVPTITLAVPIRYTHAHNGIMNRADYDKTLELLVALLQRLDAETVKELRDFTPGSK
jgi:putative aminopeptidase FrvX